MTAVGTVSKTSRGRRKGEKGGGVFSGEGERTTETVSHTVPNMASADQFPINRLAGTLDHTNKYPYFFLVLQGREEENNNRLKLARSTFSRPKIHGGEGDPGRKSRIDPGRRNKSPGGDNAKPMRSVRTEILKS